MDFIRESVKYFIRNSSKFTQSDAYLVCPICENNDCFNYATVSSCHKCGCEIGDTTYNYCDSCSMELKSCYHCGQPIGFGNDYLEGLFNQREKTLERKTLMFGTHLSVKMQKMIVSDVSDIINDCDEIINKIKGKNIDEMLILCKRDKF